MKWIHYINAVTTLHGVSEKNGLLVQGNEEPFADDEVGANVGAGDGFGVISHTTKQGGACGFGGVAGGTESQFVSADDLQRICPQLEAAGRVAHYDGLAPMSRNESLRRDGIRLEG